MPLCVEAPPFVPREAATTKSVIHIFPPKPETVRNTISKIPRPKRSAGLPLRYRL
jgi:hypothetical protein